MANFVYWRDGALSDFGPGFMVDDRPQSGDFKDKVDAAMGYIYRTEVGKLMLSVMCVDMATSTRKIAIVKGSGNSCAAGSAGYCKLANAMINSEGNPGLLIADAMRRIGRTGEYEWLATQVQATPQYTLMGPPETAPGRVPILAIDLERWVEGSRPFLHCFRKQDDRLSAIIALLVCLKDGVQPGSGSGAKVIWNPDKVRTTDTEGTEQSRPPAIGLGHELIHAYYSQSGMQYGVDNGHATTVLFEYKCVGIGPWDTTDVNENTLRAQWSGILSLIPSTDPNNQINPTKRLMY